MMRDLWFINKYYDVVPVKAKGCSELTRGPNEFLIPAYGHTAFLGVELFEEEKEALLRLIDMLDGERQTITERIEQLQKRISNREN